nr:glycosyltransferase [Aliiroseovarius subalbicans]
MPSISVVMAVHNAMPYLTDCLDGIGLQTFTDFECIIVDDASTDASSDFLKSAANADPRIRLLTNPDNIGLTRSLNRALKVASGKYIARIDADDICRPARLKQQFHFMETHPEVVACAAGYRMIDAKSRKIRTSNRGMDNWQIQWMLSFNPPAPHPTYFFRRLDTLGLPVMYNEDFLTAQDYELWSRLSKMGETFVLPEVLIDYRRHDKAITFARRAEQAVNCSKIGRAHLKNRYPEHVQMEMSALLDLFAYEAQAEPGTIAAAVQGAESMLRFEKQGAAHHFAWIRRTTAGLLADAILSRGGGAKNFRSFLAFVFFARRHLPWLLLEVVMEPALARKSLRSIFGR